jgi:uncharacterized protein
MARILISGASGLLGTAISSRLESQGDVLYRLVRRPPRGEKEIQWDPTRPIPPDLVSACDAVIHLSGENVAGRWDEAKKERIRRSRVESTRFLSEALAASPKPPATFICASAIGYYGNRGDATLTEQDAPGTGFLAEVSVAWELATQAAKSTGIRTANVRIGIVLARNGGALKEMLTPFRLGVGGKIGSGNQWWSWIHIDDLVHAVAHILQTPTVSGPVNFVGPKPATNAEFTRTLAAALHRPSLFTVPAFAARLAFGQFADEGLLSSAKVLPQKLLTGGFQFKYPDLTGAFLELLRERHR